VRHLRVPLVRETRSDRLRVQRSAGRWIWAIARSAALAEVVSRVAPDGAGIGVGAVPSAQLDVAGGALCVVGLVWPRRRAAALRAYDACHGVPAQPDLIQVM
jgi:hypothetical protein